MDLGILIGLLVVAFSVGVYGSFSGGIASVSGHIVARNPEWSFLSVIIIGSVVGCRIGAKNAGRLSARTVLALLAAGLAVAGLPFLVRGVTRARPPWSS